LKRIRSLIGNYLSNRDILSFYDCNKYTRTPKKSKEGVIIYRTFMGGGSTVVATGNIVRCYEKEFKEMGIDLSQEFKEAENEIPIRLSTKEIQTSGSRAIYEAALSLGYQMEAMPKAIDQQKCIKCGLCINGCKQGAKWTAKNYLNQAVKQGAVVRYDSRVEEVLIDQGQAYGVRGVNAEDEFEYEADKVILAAGGLGTPVILQNSKINNTDVGKNLFIDIFVNVYGITDDVNQLSEPPMEFVDLEFHDQEGFLLSPFINRQKMIRFIEAGLKGMRLKEKNLYVCDASVFPSSPGMPPILTIVALAKKLAKDAA
jgi:choline dehydrogenase-like flavoprotein